MTPMRVLSILCSLFVLASPLVSAQDANVVYPVPELERMLADDPFTIVSAVASRPGVREERTLKAELSFDGRAPLRVKLRNTKPGADDFNNEPRYDLAAYELQRLFLDPSEYVVPPTALRFVPLAEMRGFSRDAQRTFIGAEQVLTLIQYWLQDVKVVEDALAPALYAADPVYARHVEQLNLLTCLIDHGDSNVGNFLVSRGDHGQRVFSVDNGVAFASGGDRGRPWNELRVAKLPADTVERLRRITRDELRSRLGVIAQWRLEGNHFVPSPLGSNLRPSRGVRREEDLLQMGLTTDEIERVWTKLQHLLALVDDGRIKTYKMPDVDIGGETT
ncbi:MAG: hypothetical protein FIB04_02845 [Gammaproteobacteria bacterium]|nr:hypothetical protein [Gammaproteobacteria bacterium]